MAAHPPEQSTVSGQEEGATTTTAPLYPNAFGIPLKEGEQPRNNITSGYRLPTTFEPPVHFHRFREPLDSDSVSHGVKLHVLWNTSPENIEKAHHLVYYYFGTRRVTEDGRSEVLPPEERIAPPRCFLAANPCASSEGDTSATSVELSWEHDIKIGARQIHCVTASSTEETVDSVPVLSSIAICTNDSVDGDDTSSPSEWQACPCSSDAWILHDDPNLDEYLPEHETGEWLDVVLWRLEDVISLTKSPNIAFEAALCYCLLCENSLVYDRIYSEKSENEAIYAMVAECDGVVADLIQCDPAIVSATKKRPPHPTYYMAHYNMCVNDSLEYYNSLYPKHLTKSALKQ